MFEAIVLKRKIVVRKKIYFFIFHFTRLLAPYKFSSALPKSRFSFHQNPSFHYLLTVPFPRIRMPFRTRLPIISESSSGATAATRDPRRASGVHIQRSLDESAVRRSHQHPHSSGRLDEERLGHGQHQEVSLSDTAITMKTSSEGRLEEAGSDTGGAAGDKEGHGVGTGGARGKVRLGDLNKAKSSSTSQLSQTGKSETFDCGRGPYVFVDMSVVAWFPDDLKNVSVSLENGHALGCSPRDGDELRTKGS